MKLFFRIALALWVGWMAGSPRAMAQNGPKILKIEIKHVGPPAASDDLIRSHIRVKEGDAYQPARMDDDVRTLYKTGFFYNIRVTDQFTPDGVNLTYVLQGKPRVTSIQFEGNKKYSDAKLRKKVTTKEGDPLDEAKLFTDSRTLQEMYQKAGYPRTEIDAGPPVIDELAGRGTVTFHIREGYKIKIRKVEFAGANAFTEKKLRKQIKTRKRWMFSWLTGSGVFKDDQFEDDKERLREFFRNEGYIDFEIKDVQIEQPTERSMIIRFVVVEGRQYRVGAIRFKGIKLFSEAEIKQGLERLHSYKGSKAKLGVHGLEMDVGDVFTPEGLRKDTEAIEDFYGSKGYIDVTAGSGNLIVVRIPNTESGTMDVEFVVDEGQPSFIEKIEIKGNAVTKDRVIRRELAVSPGEVFDMVKVKLSQRRLENLRYFEEGKVKLQPEPTEIPNRKNLIVGVEEKSTGNMTLGAGFSSVDSVVGFAEISQGNFDLFHPPTFRGGGQKFRLRVQLGTERQDYVISFVEPWFLGRKLALGVEMYHRDLNFQSYDDLYTETRTGARVSLERALGSDFLRGSISYTIENVGIHLDSDLHGDEPALFAGQGRDEYTGIDPRNVPQDILDEDGYALLSRVGMSLAYDTRNNTTLPDKGQRTELAMEVVGGPFGGDKDFYKMELRTGWYFKGLYTGHVLELVGRSGVADSYGDSSSVPFYERYYLGGINSLRGFQYREISPREDGFDESIGGDTYWFGSAEYSLPLIERLRLAVFYDIGNVLSDSYDFNLSDYSDNWGVGIRLNLPIGPLRLDYGIPIHHDDFSSDSGRFQFSVGYERPL